MLAGWLFADLLLVLFIAGLAALSAPPVATTAASRPKVNTKVHHPPPPPQPRVLERVPQTIYVNVPPAEFSDPATHNAAAAELVSGLQQQLKAHGLQRMEAGFVLVFAYGPLGGIDQAITTATAVLRLIEAKDSAFSQASGVGYWMGSGNFEFKIFFFA